MNYIISFVMALDPTQFIIGPAIVMAIILSIIEIGFVHADEVGLKWLTHALHTIPFMFVFTFIAMNIHWALGLIGVAENLYIDIGARVVIGIVAMVKIAAAASVTGDGKIGESKFHILIIGLLVMASPYIWVYALDPVVGKFIPF